MMERCSYSQECSGCSLWDQTHGEQLSYKTALLKTRVQEFNFDGPINSKSLGPIHIRDKCDIQWRKDQGWGFFRKRLNSEIQDSTHSQSQISFSTENSDPIQNQVFNNNEIIPIKDCPLFTKPLAKLFSWWKTQTLESPKASVRLRVNSEGHWGVWLDMANIEIKNLLTEDEKLQDWTSKATIEIGQKYKVLQKIEDRWRLTDPVLKSWFQTCDLKGNKYNLFGSIGSFSQTGEKINELLIQVALKMSLVPPFKSVLELGAGSGNFTLPLAAEGFHVQALEKSEIAMEGLKKSLTQCPELQSRINLVVGDFEKKSWADFVQGESLLFLDPPRSGMGKSFEHQLSKAKATFPAIVYVSCGVESWVNDAKILKNLGYSLEDLAWVDQFPNTLHMEIVSLWKSI